MDDVHAGSGQRGTGARYVRRLQALLAAGAVATGGADRSMTKSQRLRAYFGLDGRARREDWLHAAIETLPPVVAMSAGGRLDGVGGLLGYALEIAYGTLAILIWLPLVARVAPWRRKREADRS